MPTLQHTLHMTQRIAHHITDMLLGILTTAQTRTGPILTTNPQPRQSTLLSTKMSPHPRPKQLQPSPPLLLNEQSIKTNAKIGDEKNDP